MARPNGQNFHKETHGHPRERKLKNSKFIFYSKLIKKTFTGNAKHLNYVL